MRRGGSVLGLLCCAAVVAFLSQAVGVLPAEARAAMAQDVPGMSALFDVWCDSGGTCLGVGESAPRQGAVVVLRDSGEFGPIRQVPGTATLSAIACADGGACIATARDSGGGPAIVKVGRDGSPGAARTVSGVSALGDVTCPTATTCLANGVLSTPVPFTDITIHSARFVVITRGAPSPAQLYSRGAKFFGDIACPSPTRCLTVGDGSIWVLSQIDGKWSARVGTPAGPFEAGRPSGGISCPSATVCWATASGFISMSEGLLGVPAIQRVTADGVAGPAQILLNRSANANHISCAPGTGVCTLAGNDNVSTEGLTIEVARGSPTSITYWANSNFFTGVSCVTEASCGLSGIEPLKAVFGWKGPIIT